MKPCHCGRRDKAGAKDFHSSVEAIVDDQIMRHSNTVGFHGVALSIMVISDFSIVKIRNSTLTGHSRSRQWLGAGLKKGRGEGIVSHSNHQLELGLPTKLTSVKCETTREPIAT